MLGAAVFAPTENILRKQIRCSGKLGVIIHAMKNWYCAATQLMVPVQGVVWRRLCGGGCGSGIYLSTATHLALPVALKSNSKTYIQLLWTGNLFACNGGTPHRLFGCYPGGADTSMNTTSCIPTMINLLISPAKEPIHSGQVMKITGNAVSIIHNP